MIAWELKYQSLWERQEKEIAQNFMGIPGKTHWIMNWRTGSREVPNSNFGHILELSLYLLTTMKRKIYASLCVKREAKVST